MKRGKALVALLLMIASITGCHHRDAPSARLADGREAQCKMLPVPHRVCPGDAVAYRLCADGVELVTADGSRRPMPHDFFAGGWSIVASETDLPDCPDGSRPKSPPLPP